MLGCNPLELFLEPVLCNAITDCTLSLLCLNCHSENQIMSKTIITFLWRDPWCLRGHASLTVWPFFLLHIIFFLTLSLVVLYLLYTIQCTSWSISNFYFFLLSNMMCLCKYSFKWYLDLQICGIYHEIWKVISAYAACDWNSTYASQKEKIKGKRKTDCHSTCRLG